MKQAKLEQVKYDADPRRCQSTNKYGQCRNVAVPGSKFCTYHGGKTNTLKYYKLTETGLQATTERNNAISEIKSLRDEIQIARALVERRLNVIQSNADLLSACSQVNTMLLTIEKLVSSAHKLEVSLGHLLSRTAIVNLTEKIIDILVEELSEIDGFEEIIDRISDKMLETLAQEN